MSELASPYLDGFEALDACAHGDLTLHLGALGDEVYVIQRAMIALGWLPKGSDSGFFGPKMEIAVKTAQTAAGLPVTGDFDKATILAFDAALTLKAALQLAPPPKLDASCPPTLTASATFAPDRRKPEAKVTAAMPATFEEWVGLIACAEREAPLAGAGIHDRLAAIRSVSYHDEKFTNLLGPPHLTIPKAPEGSVLWTLAQGLIHQPVTVMRVAGGGTVTVDVAHLFTGFDAMVHPLRRVSLFEVALFTPPVDSTEGVKIRKELQNFAVHGVKNTSLQLFREDVASWLGDVAQAAAMAVLAHLRKMSFVPSLLSDVFGGPDDVAAIADQYGPHGSAGQADLETDILPYLIRAARQVPPAPAPSRDARLTLTGITSIADWLASISVLPADRQLRFATEAQLAVKGSVQLDRVLAYHEQVTAMAQLLLLQQLAGPAKLQLPKMGWIDATAVDTATDLSLRRFHAWLSQ